MALDEYRRKRDFTRSPEPKGDAPGRARPKGEPRFFCVQKHQASHLHYDFRLEHNGVLLSWAVPKGPSLDPSVKRLAMHVEDHPFEYGEFEGVIPEGYGAGVVMLWDRGTWTPDTGDVDAALKKGDLKFTLDGYKLKGSWVLVRTGGRGRTSGSSRWGGSGADRSWLLIKHRDTWSGELDITEFAPLSVKTERTLDEILHAERPDVWLSNPKKRDTKSTKRTKAPKANETLEKPKGHEDTKTRRGARNTRNDRKDTKGHESTKARRTQPTVSRRRGL